jgi:hypothetical protein
LVKKYTPTGRPVGRPKGSRKYPELKDSWTQGLKRNVAPEQVRKEIRNFKPKDLPQGYNPDKIVSKRLNILRTETMHERGFGKKGLSTKKNAVVRRSARAGIKKGQSKAVYTGFLMQLQKESLGALLASGVRGTKRITFTRSKLAEAVRHGVNQYCQNNIQNIESEMIHALREQPKTGRIYPELRKNGVIYTNHQASSIGESPAVLTGEFIGAYRSNVTLSTQGLSEMNFYNNTDYTEILYNMGRDIFPINQETDPSLFNPYVKVQVLSGMFDYLQNRYQYFSWGGGGGR